MATCIETHALPRNLSSSEMDSLNRSLTNLQWLCDMRLNPVLSPNVQPGAAAPASCATAATITPAAPASAKPSACKPEMSYADLICVAMENSSKDGVTLNDIYTYISEHFPYYRKAEPSWKNSIRYNLSQNKLFCKIAAPGVTKGVLWALSSRMARHTAGKKKAQKKEKLSKKRTTAEMNGDWEEVEEIFESHYSRDSSSSPATDMPDGMSFDGSDDDSHSHPWDEGHPTGLTAEDISAFSSLPVDSNMAASLASCLSIWPLSGAALAAEGLMASSSFQQLEFSLRHCAESEPALPPPASLFEGATDQDSAPIPQDWLV